MHTAAALMFFVPVALAAAIALATLGRRGPQPVLLPAARTVALITLAVCYTAALFHLGAS
ncbi:MAG TPA: hypothetical protein DEQ61_13150 [Streptomyces sp.]|nr:hypothetical protein [Streptomyces sp.]